MKVSLIGLGCGTGATMTAAGRAELEQSQLLVGAERLLEGLESPQVRVAAVRPQSILEALTAHQPERAAVVFSGDTGFYSGAKSLLPLLEAAGIEAEVFPGISSLQYFAARLGRSWQDWNLCSAHGVACDPVWAVMGGKPAFFLTGTQGPAALCRMLSEAGLGKLPVTVGERLSYSDEKITRATAAELAEGTFDGLSVMLAEAAPRYPGRTPGIADEEFLRGQVPMTKQEVRAAILCKLAVSPADLCWDIGAGTGSVSVELALQCRQVWAVERDAVACGLIAQNRERFRAWNLHVVQGDAPENLALPKPDKVFVGGSGGRLRDILAWVREANPQAAVCVSAIALETLGEAVETLSGLGYGVSVTQIAVSRAKPVGALHLMMAQNPVYLITGAAS